MRSMKKIEFLDFIPGTAEFRIRRMEEERVEIPETISGLFRDIHKSQTSVPLQSGSLHLWSL